MTWLFVAFLAQVVLGTSAVFDKMLLKKGFGDPWVYSFWFGILGIFSLPLLPFGVLVITPSVLLIGLAAGASFLLATLFVFLAIKHTNITGTLAVIGGLSPMATLLASVLFLGNRTGAGEIVAMSFLVIGAFVFFFAEENRVRLSLLGYSLAASALFGLSNVLTKITFEQTNFLSGFFWPRIGGICCALVLLLMPSMRRRILHASEKSTSENRLRYFANRIYGSIGSFLVSAAIFLAHPALVDATQSFKYAVIFIAAWFLLRERSHGKELVGKVFATVLVAIGLVALALVNYAHALPYDPNRSISWGITFSPKYATTLGVDWKESFHAIVDELHPAKLRLIAYWDVIEKERGRYDFSDLDWQLEQAVDRNIPVVLVVGMKVPRWPECHIPKWAEPPFIPENEREEALRSYVQKVIERYRAHSAVILWQVENEPFLTFGLCPDREKGFLEKETALVRSLDPSRKILITDGGEFGLWYKAVRAGDVFGTTMYRRVWPLSIGRYTGQIDYPLDPSFFRFKARVVRWLAGEWEKPFTVIELQAEAWGRYEIPLLSYDEQIRLFTPDYFRETIQFARETGFDEYYLWGAEWWYTLKTRSEDPRMWDEAKALIAGGK